MLPPKKIISLLIKLAVGIGSCLVIWLRLKNDLSPDKIAYLAAAASSPAGLLCFFLCLLLIPLNWGLEAFKWQLITAPIQAISYKTAQQSVYSGVCVGNLAPGRATEFLGKIVFFDADQRPRITVIHFLNGLFQLSVTLLAGLAALFLRFGSFGEQYRLVGIAAAVISLFLLALFVTALVKTDWLLKKVAKRFNSSGAHSAYPLGLGLVLKLFGLSVLRFSVFFAQLLLLIELFHPGAIAPALLVNIALYFLLTTVIPMFSLLEGPIRAAIALVVFQDSGISAPALALSSVLLWLVNIVIPSIAGYVILLKQNFNFKLARPRT